MEFTIELICPGNHKAKWMLPKSPSGNIEIICTVENIFYREFVLIIQQIIRIGQKEIIITSIKFCKELDWIKDTTGECEVIDIQIPDATNNGARESDEAKESD